MTSGLLIICPQFPPARGGLADHTVGLARSLHPDFSVGVLTSAGCQTEFDFAVHPRIANWHDASAITEAISEYGPGRAILWQYVPHMYGRGGVNRAVPAVMARLGKQGRFQFVIAHEIAGPWSIWPQRFWFALAHRRQWRQIARSAGAIGFSTEAWLEQWRRRRPDRAAAWCLLPSPSGIPVRPPAPEAAANWRARHGISGTSPVLLFFGSLSAAKQFDWVLGAWRLARRNDPDTQLIVIGDRPAVAAEPSEAGRFQALGYLSPDEASLALQSADLLLLPFVDGVSERRTSFMAGLSHGIPVVTTLGSNTGPGLRRADFFAAASSRDRTGFLELVRRWIEAPAERRALGRRGQQAYQEQYDWPVVRRRIAERLRAP